MAEVRERSIVTAGGRELEVDALVFGTGFHVLDMPVGRLVRGRDGRTLADVWDGSPHAHLGSTVPGFPNLFILLGPNTGLGHSSMVYMIESQIAYVMDALRAMRATGADVVEVRPEVEARLQRGGPAAHAGHGLEHGLHELVPGREGQQPDALARLDVALPAPHRALRPGGVRGRMTRVIITGAAGGIGTRDHRRAAPPGRDRRRPRPAGADIECDVRDQASVDRAVAAGDRAPRRPRRPDQQRRPGHAAERRARRPTQDALDVLAVNLVGPWRVTAAALPALRASRGRVVNVASGLAHITVPFATAYTLSKRGVVAYSDSLRLEEGDRITVTTVYPGYIRTRIHERSTPPASRSRARCPAERVEDAAGALTRAALGPPVRDLATTRQGELGYRLARLAPRRLLDRITTTRMRRLARRGHFDAAGLAGEYAARLRRAGAT